MRHLWRELKSGAKVCYSGAAKNRPQVSVCHDYLYRWFLSIEGGYRYPVRNLEEGKQLGDILIERMQGEDMREPATHYMNFHSPKGTVISQWKVRVFKRYQKGDDWFYMILPDPVKHPDLHIIVDVPASRIVPIEGTNL